MSKNDWICWIHLTPLDSPPQGVSCPPPPSARARCPSQVYT
jgi:hypothetical protein